MARMEALEDLLDKMEMVKMVLEEAKMEFLSQMDPMDHIFLLVVLI